MNLFKLYLLSDPIIPEGMNITIKFFMHGKSCLVVSFPILTAMWKYNDLNFVYYAAAL